MMISTSQFDSLVRTSASFVTKHEPIQNTRTHGSVCHSVENEILSLHVSRRVEEQTIV